jgi:hypothetical protein
VLIQQQSADATKQQFTSKGSSILEKVKPTREGLANNKDTAMDQQIFIYYLHITKIILIFVSYKKQI